MKQVANDKSFAIHPSPIHPSINHGMLWVLFQSKPFPPWNFVV
jgi:hypothetical protein